MPDCPEAFRHPWISMQMRQPLRRKRQVEQRIPLCRGFAEPCADGDDQAGVAHALSDARVQSPILGRARWQQLLRVEFRPGEPEVRKIAAPERLQCARHGHSRRWLLVITGQDTSKRSVFHTVSEERHLRRPAPSWKAGWRLCVCFREGVLRAQSLDGDHNGLQAGSHLCWPTLQWRKGALPCGSAPASFS